MLRRRDRRLLQDSKVIPTDHVAAQHHLLVMDLKISRPRKRHPRTETQRIKWWNLKDRKEIFFAYVAPSALPYPTRSVEEMWSSTSSVIRLTAENTLGKTTLGKPKVQKATWFWNEEVQAAIREKKSKYKLWWRTRQPEDRDAYLAAKREAKKAVFKAKSDRYKAVYDMVDTREGEQAVYRLVRARHRSTLDMEHSKIVKGADGAVLRRPGQILESVESPVLPITAVEVSAALAKMKSNKATEGRTPDVWQTSVTVPVWKGKGDIADCTSYRPTRLLCHTMKVPERVLEARLRKIVSVSLNQCGFVKDCSTIDAIHAGRIRLEKHREKNRSVHLAFLDVEKAFDRVPHELLWMSIRSHRVPEEYVRWTKLLYAKPTSVVRCAAGTSRSFPVEVGVHQGSSLSPLLFILRMDTITKEIQKQHPWTLLFADDVMLASESRGDLKKQVQSWKDRLQKYGLHLNTSRTEYMECGPRIEDGSIRVDGTELNKAILIKKVEHVLMRHG
ncbi:hypothetical protein RB195_009228 [Necator americanus]|uniref:Reverse transcriptase domain-containing protein n=1 Tax=Necator americanus TaxID=51031 RepID=A0ABR1CSF2_NECAM